MANVEKTESAIGASAVTPSDSAQIAPTRGVFVGGAGDLRVDMANGDTVTFAGLAAGSVVPIQVTKVYSTSTTATSILALY
jgi:hypothetical protein